MKKPAKFFLSKELRDNFQEPALTNISTKEMLVIDFMAFPCKVQIKELVRE